MESARKGGESSTGWYHIPGKHGVKCFENIRIRRPTVAIATRTTRRILRIDGNPALYQSHCYSKFRGEACLDSHTRALMFESPTFADDRRPRFAHQILCVRKPMIHNPAIEYALILVAMRQSRQRLD